MFPFYFQTQHLLIIVIAFIAGICWADFSIYSLIGLGSILWLSHKEENLLVLFLAIFCFFFFGACRYYQNKELYFSNNNLLGKKTNVTGTIQEILPRLNEQEDICIVMKVSKIETEEKEYAINKKVYLFLPFYTKLWIQPYQKIVAKNIIFKHPHSISYQEYLIKERIWAVAHQKYFSYTTIAKPSLLMQQINEICNLSFHASKASLHELTQTLYLSIFCGKKFKSETTTTIKKLFQYWGISHYLARSGLHLILLIGILLTLLSFVPYASLKKEAIILMLLSFYYITTYTSIAFVRAFYMYVLYTLCKQLYIASQSIHIFLITTLCILIINPHHLFFLDFQLSFGITLLILWFFKNIKSRKTIASF